MSSWYDGDGNWSKKRWDQPTGSQPSGSQSWPEHRWDQRAQTGGGEWYERLPEYVYRSNRCDLSDLDHVNDELMHVEVNTFFFKMKTFTAITTGHIQGCRSPFVHTNMKVADAAARVERSQSSRKNQGYLVRLNLWEMARKGQIREEDVLDISTWEKQEEYWRDTDCFDKISALKFNRDKKEILLMWKGRRCFYEEMELIADDGTVIGKLQDRVWLSTRKGGGFYWGNGWDPRTPASVLGSQPSVLGSQPCACLLYTSPSPRD